MSEDPEVFDTEEAPAESPAEVDPSPESEAETENSEEA